MVRLTPPWLSLCIVALCGVHAPSRVRAQDADSEQLTPPLDAHGFVGMLGTRTPGPWGVDLMWWQHYAYVPLRLAAEDGVLRDVVRHRLAGTLSAQLGLGGRVALSLALPSVLHQTQGPGEPRLGLRGRGVGDPRVGLRVRAWGDPVTRYGVKDGAALALQATYGAPLGAAGGYFSSAAHRLDLDANIDVEAFGLSAGAALGYRLHAPAVTLGATPQRHVVRWGVGLKLPLPLVAIALPGRVKEAVIVELAGATDPEAFFERDRSPLEGRFGYRIQVGDFHLSLVGGAGLIRAVGTPAARLLLGVGWSPRVKDQDADGVADAVDECKHLAEDRDGFQDEDGCPEPDNDQDLVLDEDDLCPNEAAEEFRDEDEDGCTDPPVDTDGDGLADHEDRCPDEPEDRDGVEDGDGCPDEAPPGGPAPPAGAAPVAPAPPPRAG